MSSLKRYLAALGLDQLPHAREQEREPPREVGRGRPRGRVLIPASLDDVDQRLPNRAALRGPGVAAAVRQVEPQLLRNRAKIG